MTDLAAALNPTETMNSNPLIAMLHIYNEIRFI